MPVWAWVLIGLFVLLLVPLVAFFVWATRLSSRVKAEVLDRGEDTAAWIVDVQPAEGLMWPIALVLVSPDPDATDEVMRGLADRLRQLRLRKAKPANKAEREAVRMTATQADCLGRQQLPDGFTGGREVYAAYMDIGQDDEENLPRGALDGEWFPVRLIWDEHPTVMVVPPPRRKKKRARRND